MEQKREEGKKGAKKGGKLGQGVGALKRGGGWNLLTNCGKALTKLGPTCREKAMKILLS